MKTYQPRAFKRIKIKKGIHYKLWEPNFSVEPFHLKEGY
jgi:hypothetical protein